MTTTENQPFFESGAPRAALTLNGGTYELELYTIETNAHGATNTAEITLTVKNNPDFTVVLFRDQNFQNPVYVEIDAGFGSSLTKRFYGVVDQYTPDLASDTIKFQCRSVASALVDARVTTNATGLSQTSVAFLKAQAAVYGINVVTYLPNGFTPVTIGDVFRGTYVVGVKNLRVWDVLVQCAQFDDVDLWEQNGTLYYAAPGLVPRTRLPLRWLRDVENVEGVHAPNFNRNVEVVVRTFQPRTRTSVSARTITNPGGGVTSSVVSRTVTSNPVFGTTERVETSYSSNGTSSTTVSNTTGGAASGSSGGSVNYSSKERYVIYVPNQSPQIVQRLAQAKWRQISMHEYSATITLPVTTATSGLSITSLIDLSGHPYEYFNTQYWPRRITESFDTTGGWRFSVDCVNHTLPLGAV